MEISKIPLHSTPPPPGNSGPGVSSQLSFVAGLPVLTREKAQFLRSPQSAGLVTVEVTPAVSDVKAGFTLMLSVR